MPRRQVKQTETLRLRAHQRVTKAPFRTKVPNKGALGGLGNNKIITK